MELLEEEEEEEEEAFAHATKSQNPSSHTRILQHQNLINVNNLCMHVFKFILASVILLLLWLTNSSCCLWIYRRHCFQSPIYRIKPNRTSLKRNLKKKKRSFSSSSFWVRRKKKKTKHQVMISDCGMKSKQFETEEQTKKSREWERQR